MKTYIALLLLSCMTSIAHADLYDDRAHLQRQNADQAAVQKLNASHAQVQRKTLQAIRKFGQAHSGYASQPDCFDFSYRRGSIDPSTWGMSSRQMCGQGICITVHGEGETPANHANDPLYVSAYNMSSNVSYCKVVLKNGLACQIDENFENNTYGGGCLDGNGNSRTLTIPYKWW